MKSMDLECLFDGLNSVELIEIGERGVFEIMLKLVKPSLEIEQSYIDYILEWENSAEKIVPYASRRDGLDFMKLLDRWEVETTEDAFKKGFVPATLYFLVDESMRILGAIHIRHILNDYLLSKGGHIGYGVRPSVRKKGYATRMLSLALPIAKSIGINKVLITCSKSNHASAKTIINNGGVLENEVQEGEEVTQRYWINL